MLTLLALLAYTSCSGTPSEKPLGDTDVPTTDTGPAPLDTGSDTSGDSGDAPETGVDTAPEFTDADGDGSPTPDDCDDDDPNVSPSAAEVAQDAVDNDCDGIVDLDDGSLADVSAYIEGANVSELDFATSSYLGLSLRPAPDLDGDGGIELLVGAGSHEIHLVPGSVVGGSGETIAVRDAATLSFVPTVDGASLLAAATGSDFDGDGCGDLWFAEFDDEAQRLILAPCAAVAGGVADLGHAELSRITADVRSPVLHGRLWSADAELDGDGIDEMCTVAAINATSPNASGFCCIAGDSITRDSNLHGCDDADGQVTSDLVVIAREISGVGDLDGDGYEELFAQATSMHLFHGPDLLSGYRAEGSTIAEATIQASRPVDGLATLDNPDSDRASLVLMTGDHYDASRQHNASVVTMWSRLGGGAVFELADCDRSIYYDSGSEGSELDAMSNRGNLSDGSGEIVLAWMAWDDDAVGALSLLSVDEWLSGGDVNVATVPDRLDTTERQLAYSSAQEGWAILLADLDGDADDDIVAANPLAWAGFDEGANRGNHPAGVVTVIENPR